MRDRYQRDINYLRISITDRCNLRCVYCMPQEGITLKPQKEILSLEEFYTLVQAGVATGIRKVRITGGEPLVRLGVVDFIRQVSSIPQIDDIAITTNGILLSSMAKQLKEAGLSRVNISMDTLRVDRFKKITRNGNLSDVWMGIKAAMAEGLQPIKINTVVIRGFNDDEIFDFARLTQEFPLHVRFIELMPIGESNDWARDKYVPIQEIMDKLGEMGQLEPAQISKGAGPAKYYRISPDAPGTIGFISALSDHFCGTCNRLRLTAEGKLRPCLQSDYEVDLRTPLRNGATVAELAGIFGDTIGVKPQAHTMVDDGWIDGNRIMSQIGG